MKKTSACLGILLSFVFLSHEVFAQGYSISGTVTDAANGEPLIGVVVKETASSNGTTTDIDGNYTISGESNAEEIELQFSYVGYKMVTREVSGSDSDLDIEMEEDLLRLDEVVVTGVSTAISKKTLGNAISTVSADEISESGAGSIDRALSGKLSGALVNQNSGNPAGGVSITLRGTSTVFGSSDPLYIVDGVIIDNSSPEIIDLGGYAQNRLVDINPNDIERIEVIKGAAAAALYGSRASNGVVQIFTKRGQEGKPKISFSTSFQTNTIRKKIEENMEPQAYATPSAPLTSELIPAERYALQDYIFDTGVGTENYLSISGGSGDTKYYFSGSGNYNQGIVRNSDFNRYTAKMNLDQKISEKLAATVGLGYTYSKSAEIPNGGIAAVYGALTGMNFNNNNFNPEPDENGSYTSPAGFVPNPLEVVENFDFGQKAKRFNGNFNVKYNPIDKFNVDFIVGFDTYDQNANGFIPVGSTVNTTGWARTAKYSKQLINADLNFSYISDIGEFVNSNSLLGFTLQRDETDVIGITSNNLSPVVNSTNAGTVIDRGESTTERNIQGGFIQQSFSFYDKIFVTGAFRVDSASPFGENERTQYYPKASVSYLLSEEDFLKGNSNINLLKIRAAYGESGNLTALSAYERLLNYAPAPISGQTGLVPSTRLGNQDLKPERQKEIELGFDLGLFQNRLGVEFSYYDVNVEDLLLTRTLAPTTGFLSRLENVGNMKNRGYELLLRGVPVKKGNVQWLSTITLSSNKNEVSGIEEGKIALPKSFGVSVAQNGYPLGVLDGFIYARDDNGDILLDANGLPSRAVDENGAVIRTIIGDPNPDWIGSFINEVEVSQFTFRAQLDALQGAEVFNFTDRVDSRSTFGGGARDAEEIRGELPRGFNNATYNVWERYIEDGSFVKLREISLGYNLQPKSGILNNIRFDLIGRNLASIDDYSGWDPETSAAGQTNGVRGFDFNEVPIPRTIMFRINTTF